MDKGVAIAYGCEGLGVSFGVAATALLKCYTAPRQRKLPEKTPEFPDKPLPPSKQCNSTDPAKDWRNLATMTAWHSCKLTVRWLENPANLDGNCQERWPISNGEMLVCRRVMEKCQRKIPRFSIIGTCRASHWLCVARIRPAPCGHWIYTPLKTNSLPLKKW